MPMKVTDYIPYGHESAISRDTLRLLTGMDDREIRREIEHSSDLIINMADGKGYFRPLPDEKDLVSRWINTFRSRVSEENRRLEQAEGWMMAAIMCDYMCPCPED